MEIICRTLTRISSEIGQQLLKMKKMAPCLPDSMAGEVLKFSVLNVAFSDV